MTRLLVVASMILAAVASRLIPHPPNMTAVAATALFAGATLRDWRLAFIVPLTALALSDLVIGFYSGWPAVYLSFVGTVGIGIAIRSHRRVLPIAGAALASAVLFFIVADIGVWATGTLYPKTMAGLIECFTAAIPFFRNMLVGDLFYTAVLFGGFALLERGFPTLRDAASEPEPVPA